MLISVGKQFSRRHFEICFLMFPRKQVLTFHANVECGQFAPRSVLSCNRCMYIKSIQRQTIMVESARVGRATSYFDQFS